MNYDEATAQHLGNRDRLVQHGQEFMSPYSLAENGQVQAWSVGAMTSPGHGRDYPAALTNYIHYI
jgi:hypothetical protein